MISAIVLAAGSSRRMGSINKMMLTYKNKALVRCVVENILAAGIQDLVVVTGFEAEKVSNVLEDLPVTVVFNKDHNSGLTSSIQHGIRYASGDGYMICLADMVLIESWEYDSLVQSFEERLAIDAKCICLPVYENKKGNPVIFSSFHGQEILHHKEPEGCKAIVESNRNHILFTEMITDHILRDIDYPEDVEMLRV